MDRPGLGALMAPRPDLRGPEKKKGASAEAKAPAGPAAARA